MRLDILHLWRNLQRSPASAAAAVLTLALTLGAGASVAAILDAVLLPPPPFADPKALVVIGERPVDEQPGAAPRAVRYGTFEAWRAQAESQAHVEAFDGTNLTLTERGTAERLSAMDVTPGFFGLLGVTPARGRTFETGDVGEPLAIVSHGFWRGKLGGDPNVVGARIVLGGRSHTIIGVLPESFAFALEVADIWRPLPMSAAQAARSGYRVFGLARLARGATPSSLSTALEDVSRTSRPSAHAVSTPIATAFTGDSTRTLTLLAAAAAFALLVAFTNLAGLLIVRTIDRRRELAVRSALGADRSVIVRQLLLESTVLVALGVAGGVLLATWLTPTAARIALARFPMIAARGIAMSWRTAAAVAAVALGCAGICGCIPAFSASRWSLIDVLRRGATPSPRELRVRRVFVTGEVALAFVLLVSMLLLGRTLVSVLHVNPGFDARGVLALKLSLPGARYQGPERVAAFYSAVQRALQERLGARAVSLVDELPLTGDRGRSLVSAGLDDGGREAVMRSIAPGYFEIMRIPLAAGRSFEAADAAGAPPRAVVSQLLAARLFPGRSAVGERIRVAATTRTAEIIGVAGDVRHRALDETALPTIYLSAMQAPSPSSILVVRDGRPDADTIAAVRDEVARLDRDLPVYGVQRVDEVIAASPGVPERRLLTAAFAAFAVLAVVLSAIGLFGVAAHDVACRRTELALRMAIGANPAQLLRATLGRGASMVGTGLAVGALLSIWTTEALRGVVFASGRADLASAAAAAAVLAAAGAGALLPAALRAARTDPLAALRSE